MSAWDTYRVCLNKPNSFKKEASGFNFWFDYNYLVITLLEYFGDTYMQEIYMDRGELKCGEV
jgi:hypothetical protein